ncbi:hypothetical protein GCM10025780_20720 [Frondihabitans cladoniiphilus]|uniref:Uncharacterized protein n=1 Tax=Frondihabitans cladoniiphilus TaxID=715785 RepID=A0ABP8W0H7_9MICO
MPPLMPGDSPPVRSRLSLWAHPWLQPIGLAGVLVVAWLGTNRALFPHLSFAAVVIGAAVSAALGVALILWTWLRVGGYTAYRSLQRWVRDGPAPASVPLMARRRFLSPMADFGSATGWGWVALGALWTLIGVTDAIRSRPAALAPFLAAAIWGGQGLYRVAFARRWGRRVTALYNATVSEIASGTPEDLDDPEDRRQRT